MIGIDRERKPADLVPGIERLFALSARKIKSLEQAWNPADGSPVFTVEGRYCARGWTDWTQGFQFGAALLQFDATGEREFLDLGRSRTVERMAPHLTHMGVHDHGFNNVSTYGALWRLARERRFEASEWELRFYELALQASGAVQARRWTRIPGGGFIHSFNGAHSLFVDTMRSLRALGAGPPPRPSPGRGAGRAGQPAGAARPARPGHRGVRASTTAAAATITTCADAWPTRPSSTSPTERYRGPNSQQGYSPFSTWTRGLAWAMLGFAEQLEFLAALPEGALDSSGGRAAVEGFMLEAARATCDFYLDGAAAADGIPYWDTGAPGLAALGDWGGAPRRSLQRSRAGGQLGGRDRRPGPAPAGAAPGRTGRGRQRDTRRPVSGCSTPSSTKPAPT